MSHVICYLESALLYRMIKLISFILLIFLFLLYISIILTLVIYYYLNNSNIFISHINLTKSKSSLVIFSCFFDKRYNSLRLIGISSRKVSINCSYIINNKNIRCKYKSLSLMKDSSGNNFNSTYMNILIYLQSNTAIPKTVLINNRNYHIAQERVTKKRNVLCITTMKNFVSYNLLYQSLYVYNINGITDAFLYTSDLDLEINEFKNLSRINFHIIYIINEFHLNSSFYYGQTVKYNDCLYRNMYISNYIIFADFDELLILNKLNSYDKLINLLDKGDIYYIRSSICPTSKSIENKKFHILNDTDISKTLKCCLMNSFYHRKYIITSPSKFVKINIHYIDYEYKKCKHIYVKSKYAYIHHSRIPTYSLMKYCSKWFYDFSLQKIIYIYNL